MTRTRLRNEFLKDRTLSNKQGYNKHRNYCVKLFRKTKTECYNNLNEKNGKPFLSDKTVKSSSIILVKNNEILREETKKMSLIIKTSEKLRNHFYQTKQ